MEHKEAIEMMASEQYLLDELTPEMRDAYEDHMFGCAECAEDVRFGAVFVDHAKTLLPGMVTADRAAAEAVARPVAAKPMKEKREWFAWLRPAVLVPAFACLLAVIGYQNFAVIPSLEMAAIEPQILPQAVVLHGATRGGVPTVHADLLMGSSILVELPANASYASYKLDFYNSANKLIWTRTMPVSAAPDGTVPVWLPGRTRQDSYKLAITGITAAGENVPLQQQFFDLEVKK